MGKGYGKLIIDDANGNQTNVADLLKSINSAVGGSTSAGMEYFGNSTDTKPQNSQVPVGATFFAIDIQEVFMNDGTKWVMI
jgi:hypothetical protein